MHDEIRYDIHVIRLILSIALAEYWCVIFWINMFNILYYIVFQQPEVRNKDYHHFEYLLHNVMYHYAALLNVVGK